MGKSDVESALADLETALGDTSDAVDSASGSISSAESALEQVQLAVSVLNEDGDEFDMDAIKELVRKLSGELNL
jgi:hypothetical protein